MNKTIMQDNEVLASIATLKAILIAKKKVEEVKKIDTKGLIVSCLNFIGEAYSKNNISTDEMFCDFQELFVKSKKTDDSLVSGYNNRNKEGDDEEITIFNNILINYCLNGEYDVSNSIQFLKELYSKSLEIEKTLSTIVDNELELTCWNLLKIAVLKSALILGKEDKNVNVFDTISNLIKELEDNIGMEKMKLAFKKYLKHNPQGDNFLISKTNEWFKVIKSSGLYEDLKIEEIENEYNLVIDKLFEHKDVYKMVF